jgi:alpha-tubulin suppressor-like RCC1 family protein
VVAISVGETHICAVTSDGAVWCWGGNDYGQLGNGSRIASPVPVRAQLR